MDLTMLLFLPVTPSPGRERPAPRGPEDEPVGADDEQPPPTLPDPDPPLAPDANPIDPRIWREED